MTIRVQVRGNHYVVLGANGDELLTSKEYADDSGALRSARNFYDNLASGDITLETATVEVSGRGKSSVEKWTRHEVLAEPGVGDNFVDGPVAQAREITAPESGKVAHAHSPLATSNPE